MRKLQLRVRQAPYPVSAAGLEPGTADNKVCVLSLEGYSWGLETTDARVPGLQGLRRETPHLPSRQARGNHRRFAQEGEMMRIKF